MMDRYKWISIKYDQDRDDQFEEMNEIFAEISLKNTTRIDVSLWLLSSVPYAKVDGIPIMKGGQLPHAIA